MEKQIFSIPDISCEHCVRAITNELTDLDGVLTVAGDPDGKTATVEWEAPASVEIIRKALEEIDYPAE